MAKQAESKLSRKIIATLNELPRTHAFKVPMGPHKRGVSDICVTSFGVAIWLEVKVPTNMKGMTELQTEFQNIIREAGGYGFEIRSPDEAVLRVRRAVKDHYRKARRTT